MDNNTTMDIKESLPSPSSLYLMTIQSLPGSTPKEKYRHLNCITLEIVTTCCETREQLDSVILSRNIPAPIFSLVQVLAAKRLKLREVILEALKSTNLQVLNQALRAKWFFDGTNKQVTVPYFVEQVFSFVSLRTRSRIVKALARGMRTPGLEFKAEQFFKALLKDYSLSQAMPLLPYCGENFISSAIAEYDIKLSIKMLDLVYRKYPTLAILYLDHGRHLRDPEIERKNHTMKSLTYKTFLLRLIKHHTEEFIKLSRAINNDCGRISNTRVRYLCKNAAHIFVENPNIYLPHVNYKAVYYNLTREQFVKMYCNMFPKQMYQFDFFEMLIYLNRYPKAGRLSFMMDQYKTVYKRDLLDDTSRHKISISNLKDATDLLRTEDFEKLFVSNLIFPYHLNDFKIDEVMNYLEYYPKEKQLNLLRTTFQSRFKSDILSLPFHLKSVKFLRILPDDERDRLAKLLIQNCIAYRQSPDCWFCFLAIKESFEIYREKLQNLSLSKRMEWLQNMISACEIYDNKTYLLEVLNYFHVHYKNAQPSIQYKFLQYLMQKFQITDLDAPCFHVFYEIVLRAYVKDELFSMSNDVIEKIFDGIVHRLIVQTHLPIVVPELHSVLERIVDMYLEYKIEFQDTNAWRILENAPKLELVCINMLLQRIPSIYPDDHPVWREPTEKLNVATKLIEKLHDYNVKLIEDVDNSESNKEKICKLLTRVKSYPWLMRAVTDVLICKDKDQVCTEYIKRCLEVYDKEFYHSTINKSVVVDYVKEIKSGRASLLLKKDPEKVFAEWESYFSACRKLLSANSQAAKKFVSSTKWHNQLPIKFIERSFLELDQSGSMTILGLLLDGPDLEKIILPHLPTVPTVEIHEKDARNHYRMASFIPRAINVSTPPVSTDLLLALFQGDYVTLAVRSLDNLAWCLEKSKVLTIAEKLMNDPLIGVNRHGPRLAFMVASKQELHEFILQTLLDLKHKPSVAEAIAKKIKNLMIIEPSEMNLSLLETFIDKLRIEDTVALSVLCKIGSLRANAVTTLYVQMILRKIEVLAENNGMDNLLEICIRDVFGTMIAPLLPKELILGAIKKYYFNPPSLEVSLAVREFAKNVFIHRPFVASA